MRKGRLADVEKAVRDKEDVSGDRWRLILYITPMLAAIRTVSASEPVARGCMSTTHCNWHCRAIKINGYAPFSIDGEGQR